MMDCQSVGMLFPERHGRPARTREAPAARMPDTASGNAGKPADKISEKVKKSKIKKIKR